jgi:hypothetical protein
VLSCGFLSTTDLYVLDAAVAVTAAVLPLLPLLAALLLLLLLLLLTEAARRLIVAVLPLLPSPPPKFPLLLRREEGRIHSGGGRVVHAKPSTPLLSCISSNSSAAAHSSTVPAPRWAVHARHQRAVVAPSRSGSRRRCADADEDAAIGSRRWRQQVVLVRLLWLARGSLSFSLSPLPLARHAHLTRLLVYDSHLAPRHHSTRTVRAKEG